MADVLAEAVVELEADVDKFNKDFKKSLKEAEADAKASADDIDKSFKQLTGNLGKEFEKATKEAARQFREQEREAARVAREIEREALRVQREIERETKRVQREIQKEVERTARENEKAQREYEKEFIASQRAMEEATRASQERQAEKIRETLNTVRRLITRRFSLTLGVDTSQIASAIASVTKLGALLGALGTGVLAGGASLAGIAQITLAIQELVGVIALLPAVGAAAGAVIATLTLGLSGLGDAISADSPAEFAEALEKLSDNGKKLATTIRDMKDEFDDLKKSVQQVLLADLSDEVKQLGEKLLPVLKTGLTTVAKELNLSARAFVRFLREGQTLTDIDRIFFNTAQSVGVFRGAIRPAASALRDLAAVGSDFLPIIAAELGTAAAKFGEFIKQARASGQLREFFVNAIDSVGDFLAILGNLGGAFNAVTRAANEALGGGFLDALRTATAGLEKFLKSAEGQRALIEFFREAREAARLIAPILGDLARLVLEVVLPALARLGTIAAPAINALVDGLRVGIETALPGIYAFVDALADVVTTLVDLGVLEALGNLVRVIGESLGDALRDLAPQLGNLVNSVLLKLADILPKILPALADFAGAFADLVVAALPVVDVLAAIVSQVGLPTLQRIAERLAPIISDLARNIGDVLLPVLPDLADAFGDLVDTLAPIVDDLLIGLVGLLRIIVPLLPSFVRGAIELATALQPLAKLFADVVTFIADFVTKLYEIPAVKKFMEEQLPGLLALLTGNIIVPLGKIIDLLNQFFGLLDDAGVFDVILDSLRVLGQGLTTAGEAIERLGNIILDVFSFINDVVGTSINFITTVIQTGLSIITTIFSTIWETIKTIVSLAWNFITTIIQTAIRVIIALLTGNFNAIPGIIGSALQRMGEAAQNAFIGLVGLVAGLPGRILSALGNLGSLLYGAGQSLVQGMINGLQSMIGSLASRAANMAKSALDAAKRALGISSPSKMMLVVGEEFGEGFVLGIDKMIRKASEAGAGIAAEAIDASRTTLRPADNTTSRMNEALNRLTRNGYGPPPTATTGTTTVESAPVVVAPDVRVFIGDEEITQYVTEVVDERDRRTKRSLNMGARRTL